MKCECCRKGKDHLKMEACDFCFRSNVCKRCLTIYQNPASSEKAPHDPLPVQFKGYDISKSSINNTYPVLYICITCSKEVEAKFIKEIPHLQRPKYLNFPFIHEENKALLLEYCSLSQKGWLNKNETLPIRASISSTCDPKSTKTRLLERLSNKALLLQKIEPLMKALENEGLRGNEDLIRRRLRLNSHIEV